MGLGALFDGAGVASAEGEHQRELMAAGKVEDLAVSLQQAFVSHGEAAESIGLQGIDAGLIEDDVGPKSMNLGQHFIEVAQVCIISGKVGQMEIEGALLLAEREVAAPVHRQREDIRIVTEDFRGAIALMNVEINDGRALNHSIGPQLLDGDGNVIEDAESGALGAHRVMRAAAESGAESAGQRFVGGADRSAHGRERTLHQLRGPGKADAPQSGWGQLSQQELLHIDRLVRKFNGGRIGEWSWTKLKSVFFAEGISQNRVFAGRELMSLRQRNQIAINIKERAWYSLHERIPVKAQKRLVFLNDSCWIWQCSIPNSVFR